MDLQMLLEKNKLLCELCLCPRTFYVDKKDEKVSVKHIEGYQTICYPVHRHPRLCYYHLKEERRLKNERQD